MSSNPLLAFGKLLAVLLLVAANGFFVAAEFALLGMRRSRVDELAACDEYGIIQGSVTQTNLLEAMAGDIPKKDEAAVMTEREDGSLLPVAAWPFGAPTISTSPHPGDLWTVGSTCSFSRTRVLAMSWAYHALMCAIVGFQDRDGRSGNPRPEGQVR